MLSIAIDARWYHFDLEGVTNNGVMFFWAPSHLAQSDWVSGKQLRSRSGDIDNNDRATTERG